MIMDSSNWINFNSPENYNTLGDNLLDNSESQPQQQQQQQPIQAPDPNNFSQFKDPNQVHSTQSPENQSLHNILDIQKWDDFNYNNDENEFTTNNNSTTSSRNNPQIPPITPQSLGYNHQTSQFLQHSIPANQDDKHTYSTPYEDTTSFIETANTINNKFFTPLISPAMTPLESLLDDHLNKNKINQEFFTPLTSPAINPINPLNHPRNNSSSPPNDEKKNYSKRSTRSSGRILKNSRPTSRNGSPVIKAKKSPLIRPGVRNGVNDKNRRRNSVASIHTHVMDNHENINLNFQTIEDFSLPDTIESNNENNENYINQQIYSSVNNSTSSINSLFNKNDDSKPVTPATLMNLKNNNFDTPNLPEKKLKQGSKIKEITFQTSIIPTNNKSLQKKTSSSSINSNSKVTLQNTTTFSSFKTYKQKSVASGSQKNIMDNVIGHQSQFKLNTNNDGEFGNTVEKKSSHREAEKGRRDRMNIAIHELALLIPEELTSSVSVPSKATTVELASKYIRSLIEEVETLKKNK